MRERVVILGAGESGVGSAILAKKQGADVWVSDKGLIKEHYKQELMSHAIDFEEGQHSEDKILNASVIIKSPGIPDKAPMVMRAKENGIAVVAEIEYAAQFTNAILIGITGTNGKTTTATLTYHLLQKAGLDVGLVGNVGNSFARQIAEEDKAFYVIELSSFQLDGMYTVKLDYAVLLNITPDHLDRYDDINDYVASKFRIAQNQGKDDPFIYCADNDLIQEYLKNNTLDSKMIPFTHSSEHYDEGAWVENEEFIVKLNKPNTTFNMSINQLTIAGKHNTYNSMAASIIANSLLIRKESIRESLSDFKNVEHRLEFVARVKGMDFINDSKATNVNAAWYALESMNKSVIWIAGGVDKGNDYELLKPLVKDKVRIIICLGENNLKLHKAFRKDVDMMINATSAKEAVDLAYGLGQNGEAVLLSPACASFDLFENYQDRGNQFKRAVRQL